MFVSGSKSARDVARWPQIALRDVEHTPRFQQALTALGHPGSTRVKRLVGHSYGASVVLRLNQLYPGRFEKVTAYGAPRFFAKNPANVESYSRLGDPISAFDVSAHHSLPHGLNPHSFAGF
jgi:pimeloyl-ACP methyl ester carboxylesterase